MTLSGVSRVFNGKTVLQDINLAFYYGAKIGVVGENGAGKSTLLRIMAGLDDGFIGEARLTKGMRVRLVPQEPRLDPAKDVRENLEEAVQPVKQLLARYDAVTEKLGASLPDAEQEKLMNELADLQERIEALDAWDLDRHLDTASAALLLPPPDADVAALSGGERRRVALCQALLEQPDILLLDEPTNHLDAETVEWLEQALRDYPGTVIIVTHDRYFLDRITKWILELENGRGLPFEGNYSAWLQQKAERLRLLEKQESLRQKILTRELDWIRKAAGGRQYNRARIDRYEELAGQQFQARQDDLLIQIPPGPKLGERVLEFDGVCKAYREVALLQNCTFSLPRGAVVGVVGPNGAGKTTLFRMIIGQEQPDAGRIDLGASVRLSYVDQHRDTLDGSNTIFEEITGGSDILQLGGQQINARAYVARFNFRGAQQQKKVGALSGGERNRVHLAKLLKTGGNLLLLDEPTNDLDVATLRVLEEALLAFPACAMVISHDRFFLNRVCTHLLVFEGDGQVRWFEVNFDEYEALMLEREGQERFMRRRARYHRLPLVG